MSHIFISYSHKDKAYVHKLQEALQREGFDVWIDDRIDHGTTWPIVIQRNLDACGAFIIVMTENAYESRWVHNEVTRAERKAKPFFALLLSGDTWLSLEAVQYENVTGGKFPSQKFYEGLARVVPQKDILPQPAPIPRRPLISKDDVMRFLRKAFPVIRYAGFLSMIAALVWGGSLVLPTIDSWISTSMATDTVPTAATPDSLPAEIIDAKGAQMNLVPSTTEMTSFYFDVYEVSNEQYKKCEVCDSPPNQSEIDDADFANYPVVHITWNMAKKFCEWRDARLPTKNEWKVAAYGNADDRVFPWGDGFGCDKANFGDCVRRTAPVDSFKNGVSPFGIYNTVGNVWEWVDEEDPLYKGYYVVLGGSYKSVVGDLKTEQGVSNHDINSGIRNDVGFRCARDATP